MALVVADRVQETTTTTGTGTVTLAGASAGYQSFATIGNGNTTYYTLTSGNNWEVGIGTYTSSGTTLARTTVLASSAGGTTKITLSGTSNVFVTYPAEIATMLGNPTATNGGIVYGTGTAINVSAVGTVNGYQFLQSAGAASPTWVQINSFKDVAVAPSSPAPIEGDRFFDNTTGIEYDYITTASGNQWVETSATGAASNVYTKTTFTATASQTTFTLNYNVGYVDVYLNGVKLTTSDYTASTGTTVVRGVAAALNDIVETIAWTTWAATNTAIGAGTGTSLALNGATLGSNALAVAGTETITSASANAFAVGRQGTTNPVLNVDASTASVVTGLNLKGAAAAGGMAVSVTSSGTNENLTFDAKGSGTITIAGTSTGNVIAKGIILPTYRFHAQRSADVTNFTGNTTEVTVVYDTVNLNIGGGYSGTTGKFTAPSNGWLWYNFSLSMYDPSGSWAYFWGYNSSSGSANNFIRPINLPVAGFGNQGYSGGGFAYMASGETMFITDRSRTGPGTKTATLYSGIQTYFSGTFTPA